MSQTAIGVDLPDVRRTASRAGGDDSNVPRMNHDQTELPEDHNHSRLARLAPGSSTAAIHAGGDPPRHLPRPIVAPVFQSATYELKQETYDDIDRTGGTEAYWYSRLGNPTVDAVAAKVAALEGGEAGLAFASGMAAITTTVLAATSAGGRIVAARELYGETYDLLTDTLPAAGRTVTLIDIEDFEGWARELPGAQAVYVETLSNPMLRLPDLPAIARLAREAGATTIVDSTFASPVNVRPIEHGFDLVVHSATKYLNGHSDLMAGVAVGSQSRIAEIRRLAKTLGGCLAPSAAATLDRSIKTLVLRMQRHNENALAIARWLQSHPEVEAVAYPMLESHPDTRLAAALLRGGSGIVTFRTRGGDARAGALMNALRLISQATSLGGVESLISAPYNTSHRQFSPEQRGALGILPGTLRLSVGIEDVADLVGDLDQALAQSAEVALEVGSPQG
jgi:cystathionine beta-lyase/cystathionine gamma-synthase